MEPLVLRGMAKWPDVPAVFGWVSLDRRGNWLLKGETITNAAVTAFIGRNYDCDDQGRWFFQNGPQRVYVALEYTPLVYRVVHGPGTSWTLQAHHGKTARSLLGAWLDEHGSLLLQTEIGIGVVHDNDLASLLTSFVDRDGAVLSDDELERRVDELRNGVAGSIFLVSATRLIGIQPIASANVAKRFGFDPLPLSPLKRP